MDCENKNDYKIYYKDGTTFDSSGSSMSVTKSSIKNELEWISSHIEKEMKKQGKTISDVQKIEYTLEYK